MNDKSKVNIIAFGAIPLVFLFLGYWLSYLALHIIFNDMNGAASGVYDFISKILACALAAYSFFFNKRNLRKNQNYRGLLEVVVKFLFVISTLLILMTAALLATLSFYLTITTTGEEAVNYSVPAVIKILCLIPTTITGYLTFSFVDRVISRQQGAFAVSKYLSQVGLIVAGGVFSAIMGFSIAAGYYNLSIYFSIALGLVAGLIGAAVFTNIFYFSLPENRILTPKPIRDTSHLVEVM